MSETTERRISFDQLILQIRSGEIDTEKGYQRLFLSLTPYVWKVVNQRLEDQTEDVIEEVVATSVKEIWRSLNTWKPEEGPFSSWASTIAHRRIIDFIRSYTKEVEHVEAEDFDESIHSSTLSTHQIPPIDDVISKEVRDTLLVALIKQIDPVDRDIYLLRINYEISFPELVQIFNEAGYQLTQKAIEHRFYRTHKKLRGMYSHMFS